MTYPTHAPDDIHVFEFSTELFQPGESQAKPWTSVFVARARLLGEAIEEAEHAARQWLIALHRTCDGTGATVAFNAELLLGSFVTLNDDQDITNGGPNLPGSQVNGAGMKVADIFVNNEPCRTPLTNNLLREACK